MGGGPIEGVKQLYFSMRDSVDLEIVCCDSPDSPWVTSCDLPIIHALGPSYTSYFYTPRLKHWLQRNYQRFDVIIINGMWQYHGFATWRTLAGKNIPYYIFTHGMLDPWFKRAYPLKHIKKWLYWLWVEYRILRDARSVIFTSEDERLLARKSFWLYTVKESVTSYGTASAPANKTELANNFISKFPELRKKRIILFLGRIHQKKGCDLLLHSFSRIANLDNTLHLVIAGPDQTGRIDDLKAQAMNLNILSRVTWPGMLGGKLKWGAFYASEVFCLPSHQENFGIVVAEALACGKPVLISNKVNIWREIQSDGAGFVDDDTDQGTLNNLNRWLDLDVAGYQNMSTQALKCFNDRFHIHAAGKRLMEIIDTRNTLS
jgi:glycosyltransferase involved in cell wall biosynthesis